MFCVHASVNWLKVVGLFHIFGHRTCFQKLPMDFCVHASVNWLKVVGLFHIFGHRTCFQKLPMDFLPHCKLYASGLIPLTDHIKEKLSPLHFG